MFKTLPVMILFYYTNVIICDIKYDTCMETIALDRKQTAFRLRKDLLERLKIEAGKKNRSFNNRNRSFRQIQERFKFNQT